MTSDHWRFMCAAALHDSYRPFYNKIADTLHASYLSAANFRATVISVVTRERRCLSQSERAFSPTSRGTDSLSSTGLARDDSHESLVLSTETHLACLAMVRRKVEGDMHGSRTD